MKTNEYCVDIFDNSLRRRLAPRDSEVRLAVSVIRPEDRLPAYGYADYEKLFPLPSPTLRDPEGAETEFLRMLDAASGMLCGDGIPVPRDDMLDIRHRIAPQAAEMAAAAAHDYGVGASIAVHIQVFSTQDLLLRVFGEEGGDAAAGKPLVSQEFQEPEVDDDDEDEDEEDDEEDGYDGDDEQVHGSSKRQRDDDDDDDDDDDEQVHGSTKRQRARVI